MARPAADNLLFSARPLSALARGDALYRFRRRDLVDQLLDDGVGEAAEVLDGDDERSRSAGDALPIVGADAARRLGMRRVARVGVHVDDGEAVDRDAGGDRLVARVLDCPSAIVGAVARYVDDAPVALDAAAGELLHREIDGGADRGE